jgi:transcription antitermination protein NusB
MNRHMQRQKAIECLYIHLLLNKPLSQVMDEYEFDVEQDEGKFVLLNLEFIEINEEVLIDKINPHLQQDWFFERLAYVDQAILLFAVCELERKLNDKAIIIDEAIELAKLYSDDDAFKYINAVLDKYE